MDINRLTDKQTVKFNQSVGHLGNGRKGGRTDDPKT